MNRICGMTLIRRGSILTVLLGAAIVAGCSDATGPDPSLRKVGILQFLPMTAALEGAVSPDSAISWDRPPGDGTFTAPQTIVVPDTVAVGEAFSVIVYSIGINGCWGPDGQDDTVAVRIIEVTPYDLHSGADACTEILSFLPHEETFTVDQPGEWTIRARGRRVRGSDPDDSTPVVAERIIVAR